MTYNFVINKVLRSVSGFRGVYMYDKLPYVLNEGEVIVINLATTTEASKGISGHFVVLDNRDKLTFFDPYGLQPNEGRIILNKVIGDDVNPNLIYTLMYKSNKKGMFYNDIDFQAHYLNHNHPDDLCGLYAISFVEDPDFSKNPVFRKRYLYELEYPNLSLEELLGMDRASDLALNLIASKVGLLAK